MGELGRYLVNFFIGALVSEFRIKGPVLGTFFLPSIYGLIPVEASRGNGGADSGF